jgi:hypothetical protein
MSRYFLLLLLTSPFILLSILSALTKYKLGRSTKKKFIIRTAVWLLVLIGLASTEFIYTWLFQHHLTQTEPLSLFDVIQITAIVTVFYIANQSRAKIETLEKRLQDLHQEISIRLSPNNHEK